MGNKIWLPDGTPLTLTTGKAKQVGDGNHTFEELYEHRILLFLAFLQALPIDCAWKSLRHNDGSPMYEDSFIAGLNLPYTGKQISYHLPLRYFDLCCAQELEIAPAWDLHTSFDVLDRLLDYAIKPKIPDFDKTFQKDKNPLTWVGFDFDGTLATYSREEAIDPLTGRHNPLWLGKPIQETVELAKQWIKKGVEIRILTARVSTLPFLEKDAMEQQVITALQNWCLQYLGTVIPITCCKDKDMFCLYDDRCIQILKNTGRRK